MLNLEASTNTLSDLVETSIIVKNNLFRSKKYSSRKSNYFMKAVNVAGLLTKDTRIINYFKKFKSYRRVSKHFHKLSLKKKIYFSAPSKEVPELLVTRSYLKLSLTLNRKIRVISRLWFNFKSN